MKRAVTLISFLILIPLMQLVKYAEQWKHYSESFVWNMVRFVKKSCGLLKFWHAVSACSYVHQICIVPCVEK